MIKIITLTLTLISNLVTAALEPTGQDFCCGSCRKSNGTYTCGGCSIVVTAACGEVFSCMGEAAVPASGNCTVSETANTCCT